MALLDVSINFFCNQERALFISGEYKTYHLWSGQTVCDALVYLVDNSLLDLELNFIDKLQVFLWELIVLLLLQICSYFVMREIS